MLTLTMRHHSGQDLAGLWDTVAIAWRRVIGGAGWVGSKRSGDEGDRARLFGAERARWVRVVEVTYGEAGWHVHLHVLLFVRVVPPLDMREAIAGFMWGRWDRAIVRAGYRSGLRSVGVDLRVIAAGGGGVGGYLAKAAGIGTEVTTGQTLHKRGKRGGLTPMQLLGGLVTGGCDTVTGEEYLGYSAGRWAALWAEWEAASQGRRMMGWSKGLKAEASVAEAEDQDIVDRDEGGESVLELTGAAWRGIVRGRCAHELLAAAEVSTGAAVALLASWGIVARCVRGPGPAVAA